MQKELLSAISESSARLTGVWMDALTRASALLAPRDRWFFAQAFSSPYSSRSLSKMIEAAAADLPGLVRQQKGREEVLRIKERWLEYYEKLIDDTFGIPSQSQTQRVADQWRGLLKSLSHGNFTGAGGLPLLFSPTAWTTSGWQSAGWELPAAGLFNIWADAYRRTFQQLFVPHREAISRDHEKKVRRAFEAQVKFLDFLPEFHEQLMVAARRGLENVVQSIASAGTTEITPELYGSFVKTWIANHEKELMALFLSEPFIHALAEVVRLAGKARESMESLTTAGLSLWDVPSRKELDVIRDATESLRRDVQDLREQVDRLRGWFEQEVRETAANRRPSPEGDSTG